MTPCEREEFAWMDDIEGSLDGFCRTPHLPDWAVIGRAALQLDGSGVILWAH